MDSIPDSAEAVEQNQPQFKTQHFFAVLALLLFCLVIGLAFFFGRRRLTSSVRREQNIQTALQLIKEEQVLGEFPLRADGQNQLYNFYAVLEDEVQLETPFEIPYEVGGETKTLTITTLAKIHYLDAQGVQQMVYAPFFSYDETEQTWHIVDGGTGQEDSKDQFEEWMAGYRKAALEKDLGPMTIEGRPRLNHGQIMFLGFNYDSGFDYGGGTGKMFQDVVKSFYTPEQLEEFARTGDPNVLPKVPGYGPLLILLSEGDSNRLQNQLQEMK